MQQRSGTLDSYDTEEKKEGAKRKTEEEALKEVEQKRDKKVTEEKRSGRKHEQT